MFWTFFVVSFTSLVLEVFRSYASEREICVEKFGNAYRRNREMNSTFQKHLFHHQTIQLNIEILLLSFHNTRVPSMIVSLMCSLGCVETEYHFLCTLYASLPLFCVQLDFYVCYLQKFIATTVGRRTFLTFPGSRIQSICWFLDKMPTGPIADVCLELGDKHCKW